MPTSPLPSVDELPRPGRLVVRWLVPTIVVVVAVLQISRVQRLDQSSWSGIGFGMFATVDGEDARFARGVVVDADDSEVQVVALPTSLRRAAEEARVVPDGATVGHLADRWVSAIEWPADIHGARLQVTLWGVRLRDVAGVPTLVPHRITSVERSAPGSTR